MRVKIGEYCNLKSICENGFQSSGGGCHPCDTPEGISTSEAECNKCKDSSGNPIREMNSFGYCNLKSVCENGFQDSSGGCYPCDTPVGISVGSNGTCSEACIGADKRFKRCSAWGSCYCNLCPKNVASIALNTQEMCEACGGQWNGSVCCDGDRCATAITP